MAAKSGKLHDVIVDRVVECCICSETLNDPRSLPCGHNICLMCLEKDVAVRGKTGHYPCPICRREVEVPAEGIKEFGCNILVKNLLEVMKQHETTEPCAFCESPNPEFVCVTCMGKRLCQECKRHHRRHTNAHDIVSLEEFRKGWHDEAVRALQCNRCSSHENERIRYYCSDCQRLVCTDCINLGDCQNTHGRRTVEEAAKLSKENFQTKLAKLDDVATRLHQQKDRLMGNDKISEDALASHKALIQDFYQGLVQKLEESKNGCLEKVERFHDEERARRTECKEHIEKSVEATQSLTQQINRLVQYGTPAETMLLEQTLLRDVTELENEPPLEIPEPLITTFSPDKQLASEIEKSRIDFCVSKQIPVGNKQAEEDPSNPKKFSLVTPEGLHVHIYSADITKVQVGAVTNAANDRLQHGGGVAGMISNAAGPEFDRESAEYVKANGRLKASEVMHQKSGGNLSKCTAYVINAVGPRWSSYLDKRKCSQLLEETFKNVLHRADQVLEVDSVAIPLISSGLFGIPREKCVKSLCQALETYSKNRTGNALREVHLVDIDNDATQMIIDEFRTNHLPLLSAKDSTFTTAEGLTVKMVTGDITKIKAKAIVSPASTRLAGGSGISGAIAKVGGSSFVGESERLRRGSGSLKKTEVVSQQASGELVKVCDYVIHAIVPTGYSTHFFSKGTYVENLKRTYANAFEHANSSLKVETLAVPLLATGNCGVPISESVKMLREAILEFSMRTECTQRTLDTVYVVNVDHKVMENVAQMFRVRSTPQLIPEEPDASGDDASLPCTDIEHNGKSS